MTEEKQKATSAGTPLETFMVALAAKDAEFKTLSMDKYSLGPWSISKMKMLQKCPLQFYIKYVLKMKIPEDVGGRSDTTSADIGSAAHLILEHVMQGKSIEESYAISRKEYGQDKLSDELWAERVATLEVNILAFKDRMDALGRKHKIRKVYTELRLGVTRDWKPTGFFSDDVYMRGVIDLVVELEDGVALITDHKTGGGVGSLRPYETQLDSYKVLYHHAAKKVRAAQTYVHFIGIGEVKSSYLSSAEDISGKLKDMLEFELEGSVDSVAEKGYFKHVCGSYCRWCDIATICKSKEKLLKPLELGTKRFFEIKKI